MKKTLISSLLLASALSVNAAPLVTIGDQLDLFFKGAVIGKWDSNVTYSSNKDKKFDDYSMVFRLGAEADYGRNSKFKANVKFYEDLTRYASHKTFNSNLAHVAATASYTETVFTLSGNFSFDQCYQNSSTTDAANRDGQLVSFNSWKAGLLGTYDFSDKIFGELGGNWAYIQYLAKWTEDYSDYDMYSVPMSVLYRVTEKISVGLSYQYRYTEFEGGKPSDNSKYGNKRHDHFGGITARGELLPKLSASLYAGVNYRDLDGGTNSDSDTTFALNATFSYELTEKIGLFATGKRDFGNGASRESSVDTGCEVGANYLLNQFVTFTSSFAYVNSSYMIDDRDDDECIGRVGVTYKPNKFFTLGANYRYINNGSTKSDACYNQHVVDLSVSVKY